MKHRFNVGEKVMYDGLVATIEGCGKYYSGALCYDLVSDEDEEMTCTADEEKCEAYNGEEIDQSGRLSEARLESMAIAGKVDRITDKHFRDGNH